MRVAFTHELDSHGEFSSADCGTFVPLPNGDDLETGVMPRPDVPGAPPTEYEEIWRELPFRDGPEGAHGGISWVLESDDDDLVGKEGEFTVTKTFLGRIWGIYLALQQTQVHSRRKTPSGEWEVRKSGADVCIRREEWSAAGWNAKYVVGGAAGTLPSMAAGFEGEAKGAWRGAGGKVVANGRRYVVRAFEEIGRRPGGKATL